VILRKNEGHASLVYDRKFGVRRYTLHDVGTGVWGTGKNEVRVAVVTVHGRLTVSATVRVDRDGVTASPDLPAAVADDVAALLRKGRRMTVGEVIALETRR